MRRGTTRAATGRHARLVIGRASARSMEMDPRASPRPSCSTEPPHWTPPWLSSPALPPGNASMRRGLMGGAQHRQLGGHALKPRRWPPGLHCARAALLSGLHCSASRGNPICLQLLLQSPEWRRRGVDCSAYLARCMWSTLEEPARSSALRNLSE